MDTTLITPLIFCDPTDQNGKNIFATFQLGEYEVAYVTGQVGEMRDKVLPLLPRRQSGEGVPHRQSVFVGDLKLSEFKGMLKHHNVEVGGPSFLEFGRILCILCILGLCLCDYEDIFLNTCCLIICFNLVMIVSFNSNSEYSLR